MMAAIACTPSVSAAGPGCRISGDLISCSSPSRTAWIAAQPGRAATRSGRNFLPHHEPMMISGSRAITGAPSARIRALARGSRDSSGNTSMPPAISTSSAPHWMPVMIGSSHSST